MKRKTNIGDAQVGLFFAIKNKIYGYGQEIKEYDENMKVIDYDLGHFEYFDFLVNVFGELNLSHLDDYGQFPRGRIIFKRDESKFYIYCDQCILKNAKLKTLILNEFNLKEQDYVFLWDDHYTCPNCETFFET